MLGERITLSRVLAVVIGFVGVLVVIRPGAAVFQWASLLIVCSAFCFAVYQVLTRRVAGIDTPGTSVLYSALVGSVVMSFVVPFAWRTPSAWQDVALLGSLGVLGGLGHYCVARAMTYAPANFLSPFQYWQMVGSVAVGYYMFSEVPEAFTWMGAALIIAAGMYIGLRDRPDRADSAPGDPPRVGYPPPEALAAHHRASRAPRCPPRSRRPVRERSRASVMTRAVGLDHRIVAI